MRFWSLNDVSTSTCVSGVVARIRVVASMPSIRGIDRSISTTSGRRSAARVTASSPSAASPAIRRSSVVCRSCANPRRTTA